LRARYVLYDFGERQAQLQIAQAGQGLAEEEALRIRQDIILAVYHGFFGLTSALEAKTVAGQNLERTRDHLRLTRERKEAGAVPKADVLRAQVEVSNAELALVRAENLIRLARGNLNTALGRPVEKPLALTAERQPLLGPEQIDLNQAFRQAARSRPEIKAAGQKVEAARGKMERAQSSFGPRLKAEGGYGWRTMISCPRMRIGPSR